MSKRHISAALSFKWKWVDYGQMNLCHNPHAAFYFFVLFQRKYIAAGTQWISATSVSLLPKFKICSQAELGGWLWLVKWRKSCLFLCACTHAEIIRKLDNWFTWLTSVITRAIVWLFSDVEPGNWQKSWAGWTSEFTPLFVSLLTGLSFSCWT